MARSTFIIAIVCGCLFGPTGLAEDYEYDGHKQIKNVTFDKRNCSIKIKGQCGVEGTYKLKDGTLEIHIDGGSSLEVSGEAHKVVIRRMNAASKVRLDNLKIGAGGVEIKDMDGQSVLYIGECGSIDIKSIDGQCLVHYKKGTKLMGQGNVKGLSQLKEE